MIAINKKLLILLCTMLIVGSLVVAKTKAGTILLMGIGLGTPGTPPPPPTCAGVISLQGCVEAFNFGIR